MIADNFLCFKQLGVEIDAVEQLSNIDPMVYAAPATLGVLDDQTLFTGTGVQVYDASGAFAGANSSEYCRARFSSMFSLLREFYVIMHLRA